MEAHLSQNKLHDITNMGLLAACLVVIIAGSGRVSVSHVIKKFSRWLH